MTEEERLAKNNRIREHGIQTREKRKSQICRVYRVKIDISHLNEQQKMRLKMLFVEAKWLYNDALTFMEEHDIIDMGIKTTITTSDGKKYQVLIGESERIKKCQRLLARRKKGSNNRYKARKLLQRAYHRLTRRKKDVANKIVHELLEHERIYMQDENLSGWHKGLFGRTVQHSVLGLVKAKLMKSDRVEVLPKSTPTTKYCPSCGKLKRDITLSDRVYSCSCGYSEDRDVHAARNMILLSKKDTCGTQEINAYGEDVRRLQPIRVERNLEELGSPRFFKRG